MGWIGVYKEYKTNKENVQNLVLYGKTENEKQWYREISQKGSSVYILGQNKDDKKYWVDCVLCQTTRCHGYPEFMYKGIGAISNMCFDFPKKWVALLDSTDTEVQKYIKAREEYETEKKGKYTPKIGDIFKCKCSYDLNWNSFSIPKGQEFFIKYTNFYGHKYFMLCTENGNTYSCKVTRKTFNNFEKVILTPKEI